MQDDESEEPDTKQPKPQHENSSRRDSITLHSEDERGGDGGSSDVSFISLLLYLLTRICV